MAEPRRAILVLQRGWIIVGEIYEDPTDMTRILVKKSATIGRWGTPGKGLGELALRGPLPETKLYPSTDQRPPIFALINEIACGKGWDQWFNAQS